MAKSEEVIKLQTQLIHGPFFLSGWPAGAKTWSRAPPQQEGRAAQAAVAEAQPKSINRQTIGGRSTYLTRSKTRQRSG